MASRRVPCRQAIIATGTWPAERGKAWRVLRSVGVIPVPAAAAEGRLYQNVTLARKSDKTGKSPEDAALDDLIIAEQAQNCLADLGFKQLPTAIQAVL
jgi:hypothetical protein